MGRLHQSPPPQEVRASLGPPAGLQAPVTRSLWTRRLPWAVSLGPRLPAPSDFSDGASTPASLGRSVGVWKLGAARWESHTRGPKTLCHGPGMQAGGSVGLGSVHDHLPWSVKEGRWTGVGAKATVC